jgi:hypothetical protein
MPRVGLRVPAQILSQVRARAEEPHDRDALWAQAISAYLERKGSPSPTKFPSYHDRMRREAFESARMPRTAVEVPDALFARADRLAKRLHKSRELLYSEAMAEFLRGGAPPDPGSGSTGSEAGTRSAQDR